MFSTLTPAAILLVCFLYVIIHPQQNPNSGSDSTHTLINTIPEGAEAFFNDTPLGGCV